MSAAINRLLDENFDRLFDKSTFAKFRVMNNRPTRTIIGVLLLLTFVFNVTAARTIAGGPVAVVQHSGQPARGRHGMVASQHEIASKIGVDILRKGGNAVDAAVAVGLALAVVYPEAGNIGGGGFMLIRKADGFSTVIDYRETAPKTATRDMYIGEDGKLIKGEGSSTLGYRASATPGTVAGFDMALTKYGSGKFKWADLVRPARIVARDGYELSFRLADLLVKHEKDLSKYADSKKIFLKDGKIPREGDNFVQPELAQTLERLETRGPREFYTGKTAELIAADMKANNGLITLEDLKQYQPKERTPLRGTYRGHEIITMPPPSSGGIVMLEILNMLEGDDIRGLGHNSARKYHLVAESMRRAFADRAEFMADPDFVKIPVAELIDKKYAKDRRAGINVERASSSREVGHGEVTGTEGSETTHYTIVDAAGNIVTNTYTINDLYGSAVTIRGTGILMNDIMDDFAAQPGKPNLFGLVQGDRNRIEPLKRPLSSMTPTIVMRKDGTPWFALGARGGPRIISAVLQAVINVIDHDMDIQQAINAPRVHHQWLPDEMMFEPYGMSPDTLKVLRDYGHTFPEKPGYIASATGIMIDPSGVRLGAIDSRSDGAAVGY